MKNWKKLSVTKDTKILAVMKIIDETSAKFAVVVDANGVMIGTVTDGDIRRGILKGISTDQNVEEVMNSKPQSVQANISNEQIIMLMKKQKIAHMPIVDDAGQLVEIVSLEELVEITPKSNPVIIMAGGLGSRLGILTTDCPKPMLKIGNKPILETIIENFIEHGFSNFYISVNYMSEMIENHFGNGNRFGVSIRYLKEKEKLGTAGSLGLYKSDSDLPIVVMNGDVLSKVNLTNLLERHLKQQNCATMGIRQYDYQVPYGVVVTDGEQVSRIEEKPVQSFFVSGGIYVLNQEVIKGIEPNTHLDMPTMFQSLINRGKKVGVFPINEYWLDIGRRDDFEKAHYDYEEVFK